MTEAEIYPEPEAVPPDYRSGFVAVIGRPNVGKSTLLNRLLGQKIAITSPKPQTTRDQLLGIYTDDKVQMLFLDTPGIHAPQNKLGEHMVRVAQETIEGSDLVLWVIDVNTPPKSEELQIAKLLQQAYQKRSLPPLILLLNKIDQGPSETVSPERVAAYLDLVPWLEPERVTSHALSGLTGAGIDELMALLHERLPIGPRYFPEDQVTDMQSRFIVAELIREQTLYLLQKEVPHSIAVEVDEYSERSDQLTYISAVIYVERDSQKSIVLGQRGAMIKKIGQAARPHIEELIGTKVYLELWVKVWERWRTREGMLRRLGYAISK